MDGHDRHGVRAGVVVGPQPRGDTLRRAQGAHLLEQLEGDGGRQLGALRARAGALHEVEKAELAEHFAVSGRGEIDGQLGSQLAARRVARVDCDRNPHCQARRDTPRRGGLGVDGRPHVGDPGGRNEIQHDLIGVLRRHPRHRRPERAYRDSAVRHRLSQPEAVAANMPPGVVDPRPGQDRPQTLDGLAHARGVLRPLAVMPAGHDRRTGGAQRDVDPAAGERRDRGCAECQRYRAAHTERQRSELQVQAGHAVPDRGGQRERVVGGHLADPQRVEPGFTRRQRDVQRLLVGPVQPERQGDFDTSGHSIATSAGWSSRTRPGSSRDASLT